MGILNGVTWLFQFSGLCGIAFLGDTVSFTIIKNSRFSDPTSPSYVHNPEVVAISGSIVAAVVALPFLVIFDTVSDTIIYCYTVRKLRKAVAREIAIENEGCLMGTCPCLGSRDDRLKVDPQPHELLPQSPMKPSINNGLLAVKR